MNIQKAATIGDGMKVYNEKQIADFVKFYENEINNYKVVKFVPASGAASRMFKSLFEFIVITVFPCENQAQAQVLLIPPSMILIAQGI